MLGLNIALHGAANYAIGPLPGSGDSPLIKARGHPLHTEHYHPDTGAKIESPMKVMMSRRLAGEAMEVGARSLTYKPASVSDYQRRKIFREGGGLPGYSIAKRAGVRLIPLSEFNFPDQFTRRQWLQYYAYINRRYDLGLEVGYLEPEATAMTLEQLELAKADIQSRIWARGEPRRAKSRQHKSGEPADPADPEVDASEGFSMRDDL